MSYFSIENLSISFGGIKAVDNISFSVEKNEIFSIIGPNGSGKTTIFNLISGIYKPDTGAVIMEGEDIVGKTPDRVAKKGIARTFQNIELFANATVMDNLMLGRHIHMNTGIFSGAFMFGKRSPAAREGSDQPEPSTGSGSRPQPASRRRVVAWLSCLRSRRA